MDIYEKIHEYIRAHKDEIIGELCELVRIPSVSTDREECCRVLEKVCGMYAKNGFKAESFVSEEYALSYYGEAEKKIGLFAHADVVMVDDKWTVCSPFEPKIKDGALFGRGTADDKSAIIISLYALKIIKELDIPLNSAIVCFTGASEESTMQDVRNYLKTHTPPDFSIVLDAGFPMYYGDKGILWLKLKLNEGLKDLIDISGGSAFNIILGEASARVRYSDSLYASLKENSNLRLTRKDGELHIYAKGISNHGAMPQGTKNAGGIILKALLDAPSFDLGDKEKLGLIKELLCTYDGAPLGIKSQDGEFGETTVTNGIIKTENGHLTLTLDIRYGKSFTPSALLSHLEAELARANITFEIAKSGAPHATDRSSAYVKEFMRSYEKHTSERNLEPKINAGGTYSRYLPSSVETGTTTKYPNFPLPSGHGNVHQPDEYISIDGLLEALELIVKILIDCDKLHSKGAKA